MFYNVFIYLLLLEQVRIPEEWTRKPHNYSQKNTESYLTYPTRQQYIQQTQAYPGLIPSKDSTKTQTKENSNTSSNNPSKKSSFDASSLFNKEASPKNISKEAAYQQKVVCYLITTHHFLHKCFLVFYSLA